jgi:Xaa-Pro dipeptidase
MVLRLFEIRNVDASSWLTRDQTATYGDTENPMAVAVEAFKDRGLETGRIGVEMSGFFFPIGRYEELKSLLAGADFVNGSGLVEKERAIKSQAEIAYIRRSCRLSEIGLEAAREHLRPGMTENQLAAEIHNAMIAEGCEFPGLPPFIGSGHRTQIPHVQWTDKVIEAGDNVPIELTGVTRRYAGPLFRTFAMGPSEKMAADFEVVKDQEEAAIAAIRPGVTSGDVDAAAKAAAKTHGKLSSFTKRTGYSIGLNYAPDWGEGHLLDLKENDPTVLQPGMTFHMPMSLRADGELAVAVSESVLVTETGCEVLTNFPRELIVI